MRTKLLHDGAEKTWVAVFESGEEAASGLLEFARREALTASRVTAIGAFGDVKLGFFDLAKKEYERIAIEEQVEVLSLIGDITLNDNGDHKVHAHVVVAKRDARAYGGHLLEGHVRPTLEVVVVESPQHLRRSVDPATGLSLIALDR